MRFYGLELVDVFELETPRRMTALIAGLPADAAVWGEERRAADEWTRQDELLAVFLESSDAWYRLLFKQLGGKIRPGAKPLTVRRPESAGGERGKVTRTLTLDQQGEIADWFRIH